MAFTISPGVSIVEKDLTNTIPAIATSIGAFAGPFAWGPVLDVTQITSENELINRFGKPHDDNAASWLTAASFLAYSNNMQVVRTKTSGAYNAISTPVGSLISASVAQAGTGFTNIPVVSITGGVGSGGNASVTLKVVTAAPNTLSAGTGWATGDTFTIAIGTGIAANFEVTGVNVNGGVTSMSITNAGNYSDITATALTGVVAINTTTGSTGIDLQVDLALGLNTIAVSGGSYTVAPVLNANGSNGGSGSTINNVRLQPVESGLQVLNEQNYIENFSDGTAAVGQFAAKYPGKLGNSIGVFMADSATYDNWQVVINQGMPNEVTLDLQALFDTKPGTSEYVSNRGGSNDELHIAIIDTKGEWSGAVGSVLERFAYVSKASDARKTEGGINFYKELINQQSKYIWWMDFPENVNWGTQAENTSFDSLTAAIEAPLNAGTDDFVVDFGDYQDAWGIFQNAEEYDISLLPCGPVSAEVSKWIIDNVVNVRRDCVAFVSPIDIITNEIISGPDAVEKMIKFRTDVSFNANTSYAVLDSGYKYQYDRYNDKYRWVPLNGDMAGLCARTDFTNDTWWSPGGLNRGQIKNVVKLAFNPNQAQRDDLYKNGINPVVSLRGEGVVLFGDKTLLAKPSAFDRINVRRLFIALEKSIAKAARYQLFEFNDAFTRAQFRSMVEPFLRNVQGRRGITDFKVICDETNNTQEIIDNNRFVASIFVKPARSINAIELSFVAVRTGVSFDEIVGI